MNEPPEPPEPPADRTLPIRRLRPRAADDALSHDPPPATAPEPAPTPPSDAAPHRSPSVPCPKCGERLLDPEGMAFCAACGYHRSQPIVPKETNVTELTNAAPLMIAGVLAILSLALMMRHHLGTAHPDRKVWSLAMLLGGIIIVYGSQWWALLLLSERGAKLGGMDWVIVSGRVWSKAAQHLPDTRWPVVGACWGLATMLIAVVVIGGLNEWLAAPPPIEMAPPIVRPK